LKASGKSAYFNLFDRKIDGSAQAIFASSLHGNRAAFRTM
jgi:hypothetical protein